MIAANLEKVKAQFADQPIPMIYHSVIRNSDACYKSTAAAIELALKYHTHLHVLHVSTLKELALFESKALDQKILQQKRQSIIFGLMIVIMNVWEHV